jgi:hypothetical protein
MIRIQNKKFPKGQCKLCIEDPHELATGIFYIKSIEDV